MISEPVLIALVGGACTGGGAILQHVADRLRSKQSGEISSAELLLDAQQRLAETMDDCNRLWRYNRQLVDHIYKGAPPPPPDPPENLFKHE